MTDVNAALPALLREVKSSGYRVSNLCHRMDGMVQANLRATKVAIDFHWGYGPSFVDALQAALDNARKGKVASAASVGDDAMDPRKVGQCVDPTDVIGDPRWFYHPESDCLMVVLPGEPDPRDSGDGLVEEIDFETYKKLQGKQEDRRQKQRVKDHQAAKATAPDDDDDLIGGAPAAAVEDDDLIG